MCGCNQAPKAPEPQFEVKTADGQVFTVTGEHAAKVEVTMRGGTYRKL